MAIKMPKDALDMPTKMSEHAHEMAMKMHKDAHEMPRKMPTKLHQDVHEKPKVMTRDVQEMPMQMSKDQPLEAHRPWRAPGKVDSLPQVAEAGTRKKREEERKKTNKHNETRTFYVHMDAIEHDDSTQKQKNEHSALSLDQFVLKF